MNKQGLTELRFLLLAQAEKQPRFIGRFSIACNRYVYPTIFHDSLFQDPTTKL